MVVQRTLDKIEELKERPHHERRTIALYWAIGVGGALMLLWGFFAVRSIGHTAIMLTKEQNTLPVSAQTASAAAAGQTTSAQAPRELTASSTNGRVDLIPVEQSGL